MPQGVKPNQNICDIPYKTLRQLCNLLDAAAPNSQFNWRSVIANIPNDYYRPHEVELFAIKQYNGDSPAEALLRNLGSKGKKVKHLIQYLDKSKHERALELIRDPEHITINTQPEEYIRVKENGLLTLECSASGFPYPKYQWFHGKEELLHETQSILSIGNVTCEDEGNYICRIHNKVEGPLWIKWVKVEVIRKCSKNIQPEEERQRQQSPCTEPIQEGAGRPGYTCKDEKAITSTVNVITSQLDGTCIYNKNEGRRNEYEGPPVITEQPSLGEGYVNITEPLILTCNAVGRNLQYQWIHNNALLSSMTSPQLQIDRTHLEHSGKYQCIVSNNYGQVRSSELSVRIEVPPEFWSPNIPAIPEIITEPVSVCLKGISIATFYCEARGRGAIRYQWYKNGTLLQGQCQSSLSVPVQSMKDIAQYQCEVVSDYGKKLSRIARLDVEFSDNPNYQASDKVALLIANSNYTGAEELKAVPTDLETLTVLFRKMDFKVISLLDLNLIETKNAVDAFCALLDKGVYGVFYFAGHGFEHNGQCYLAPYDARVGLPIKDCLCAEYVLTCMQNKDHQLSVLLLDICREPKDGCIEPAVPTYRPRVRGNTFIGYASSFNTKAYEDEKGFFARNLEKYLLQKKDIRLVFMELQKGIMKDFQGRDENQIPEVKCNLNEGRSLMDPINFKGYTCEFVKRQEIWRQIAGEVPVCPLMLFEDIGVSVQLICQMQFANVMKIFAEVRNNGKTSSCEAWLTDIPPNIVASENKAVKRHPHFKSSITLSYLQKLQENLRLDLMIRYKMGDSPKVETRQVPIPHLDKPLISKIDLWHSRQTQQEPAKEREPSEQEECGSDVATE